MKVSSDCCSMKVSIDFCTQLTLLIFCEAVQICLIFVPTWPCFVGVVHSSYWYELVVVVSWRMYRYSSDTCMDVPPCEGVCGSSGNDGKQNAFHKIHIYWRDAEKKFLERLWFQYQHVISTPEIIMYAYYRLKELISKISKLIKGSQSWSWDLSLQS